MELFDYNVEILLHHKFIHPREVISGDVKIKISGRATCSWPGTTKLFAKSKEKIEKNILTGTQEFFYCRHTLAGNDGTEVIMEKKSYYFPFKCKLPGHLPATWTGEHGNITYMAQVIIKSEDELIGAHKKEILIVPYRNLAFEPHLGLEARRSVTRKFRFGLVNLGNVSVTIWLPLCGIASGQSLPVICTVDNQSSVQFGGIIFFLTQIQIYRSSKPKYAVKTIRTDVCRVARITDILKGVQEFYCVLKTEKSLFPTTQFWRCTTCQLIYEVWAQIQGSLPSGGPYGYPNIDVPGIALIVGTQPICTWDINEVNQQVMKTLLRIREPIIMDPPPPDEVVEEILNTVDDEFDVDMMTNLTKQLNINESNQKRKEKSAA